MSIIPGFASELGLAGGDSIVSVSVFSTTGSVSWPAGATHVSVFYVEGGGAGDGGVGPTAGIGGDGHWVLNFPKGSNTGVSVTFGPGAPPGSPGETPTVTRDPTGNSIILVSDYTISGGNAGSGGSNPGGGGGAGPDGPGSNGTSSVAGNGGAKGPWASYLASFSGNGGTSSSPGSQFGGGGGHLAGGSDGGAMLVFSSGPISFIPAVHD